MALTLQIKTFHQRIQMLSVNQATSRILPRVCNPTIKTLLFKNNHKSQHSLLLTMLFQKTSKQMRNLSIIPLQLPKSEMFLLLLFLLNKITQKRDSSFQILLHFMVGLLACTHKTTMLLLHHL